MLRRSVGGYWIALVTILAIPVAVLLAEPSGRVADECTRYDGPGETACRYLSVVDAGVQWLADLVKRDHNDVVVIALASVAIAVFTAFLWRSTYKLWKASEAQMDLAIQTAEALPRMERAYLFLFDLGCFIPDYSNPAQVEMPARVSFTFMNYGRTPAIVKEIIARVQYFRSGCPDETAEAAIGGAVPIGTAVGMHFSTDSDQRSFGLSKADFDNCRDGIGSIIFWGEVSYWDVFGKLHHEPFGRELRLSKLEGPRFRMAHCPGMNTYS